MRVFVTGATGWVGEALVPELMGHGHTVLGLVRNGESKRKLEATGAEAREGGLDDVEVMAAAARECDAVVHLAFRHDLFSDYGKAVAIDMAAIGAMAAAMEGTGKALVGTGGLALGIQGRPATEEDAAGEFARGASENLLLGYAERGVRAMHVRLSPSVHGKGDHGFVPMLIGAAQKNGFVAYTGEGANRWSGVAREDAARLYRLAVERGTAGARYHGVAEEGIAMREIAETMAAGMKLPARSVSPDELNEALGFMAMFVAMNLSGSSQKTQAELGWRPEGIGLLEDIRTNYVG